MSLRKTTKKRGSFPRDNALLKLLYLALDNIAKIVMSAAARLKGCIDSVYHPV